MTIKSFTKMHPVLTYLIMTFAISWGWILVVVGPGGFPVKGEQFERLMVFVYPAMFAAPSLAGILLTGLTHGRVGFRELGSRLFKWRVGARWYVVALLTAPLLIAAVLLPLLYTSDDKAFLLWYPITAGLITAIFEELGWTGLAVATMLRLRRGVLSTGLSAGLFFGAWNFLVVFWASGDSSGALSLPLFLPWVLDNVGLLPVYRVLMVWVYDRTGSLLVAMLMHASLTGGLAMILMPLAISGVPNLIWYLVLTAVLWVVVAAVGVANGGQLSLQPLSR
jgi:hypothetical protein